MFPSIETYRLEYRNVDALKKKEYRNVEGRLLPSIKIFRA